MTMTEQNFIINKGESRHIRIQVNDDQGQPYDLTGCSAEWVLKRELSDSSPALSKGIGTGLTILAPATSGVIDVALTSTDTGTTLAPATYHHACTVTSGAGEIVVVTTGEMLLQRTAH